MEKSGRILIAAVVLSVIAGAVSGALASYYFFGNEFFPSDIYILYKKKSL